MSFLSFINPYIQGKKVIDVLIKDERWEKHDLEEYTSRVITHVLDHEGIMICEISLCYANDKEIHNLNFKYRGKDKPTNVLSFGYTKDPLCGDIILSYETILHQAIEQKKNFHDHLTHLIIHGTLHLIGYDHENDKEAEVMEKLEQKLLGHFGIMNPYDI